MSQYIQEEIRKMREAVAKFLAADGNDLCHDNRRELAAAFGLAHLVPRPPATVEQFARGCEDYMVSLYGRCPTTALRQELHALRDSVSRSAEACDWMRDDKSLGLLPGDTITTDGVRALKAQRDRLQQEVLELKASVEWWADKAENCPGCASRDADNGSLCNDLTAARAALKPFADLASHTEMLGDDFEFEGAMAYCNRRLTIGDLRAARTMVAKIKDLPPPF